MLDGARGQRRTLTYLEIADALELEPPQRIHRATRLIEMLLAEEIGAGRVPLAALAVSRARGGLPAPGFFDRLRRLGIDPGPDPAAWHRATLEALFEHTENDS